MSEQIYTVKVSKFGTFWFRDPECTIFHRKDGPAVEYLNGGKEYWVHGELHREDGPAIEGSDGYKAYRINGKRHREDGLAIEYSNGYKEYWLNGELHRDDGPAIEYHNGDKFYYLNGVKYSEKEYWREVNKKSCSNKIVEIDGKKYKLVEV